MPTRRKFPIEQKKFKSFDGTVIGYQSIGQGKKPIVLCNGLGGFASAWTPLFDHFADSYRFVTWDYRGLAHSDPPHNPEKMKMEDHVGDLEELLKKEGIKKAFFGGWSMGVQIALEYYRKHPASFEALFLLNGTSGYPFDTALNNPLSKYVLPTINDLAQKIMPAVQPSLRPLAEKLIDWEGFAKLAAKLGLIHENIQKQEIFQQVAKEMIQTDLSMYHQIMSHLSQHDATDVLATIRVPVLMIAGNQDMITPVKVAEKMAALCPHAELFIVPGGTHYSILEFPEIINLRMEKFLGEHYH